MNGRAASAEFEAVTAEIGSLATRPEIVVRTAPGPTKLAPFALALIAAVTVDEDEIADGRLVLLHDPAGQDSWEGTWRMVLLASADLDETMADDPVLLEVGWAWLEEALEGRDLTATAFGGTVTRTSSRSFGLLADRPPTGQLEIRASWTPVLTSKPRAAAPAVIREHVRAWIDLLCLITSLEPHVEGVARLRLRRP